MFQFTNTSVINSDFDELSGKAKFEGKDNVFKVLRIGKFDKTAVRSFYKRQAYKGTLSKATFVPPTAPTGAGAEDFYRIELFMRLSGSQSSTMATAGTVYKSRPIHIEFKVSNGDSASTVANNMVKAVAFYQANLHPYITASVSGNNVVISGVDEYEVFNHAELQKLISAAISVYPDDQNQYKKVAVATIENGKEGFGTYTYVMKNLRLPTLEALRFGSPTQDELPVLGALYNQYTLEYCKDRGIMGAGAVGDQVTSVTHQVFFVRQDLSAAFEAAVTTAGLTLTEVTEGTPVSAEPVVAIPTGQKVAKDGQTALKYTVDGVERLSGGTWALVGSPTGVTVTGNLLKATTSATAGTVTVKLTLNGKDITGTVAVTE